MQLVLGAASLALLVPPAGGDEHEDQQNEQNRGRHQRCHDNRLEPHGVCSDTRLIRLVVVHTVAAHQETVGIDTVGRAGDQRAVVHVWIDLQVLKFLRQDDSDLVHFIGQCTVEDLKQKFVARLQLIDISEQLGGRQSAVSRYSAVRSLAADRE